MDLNSARIFTLVVAKGSFSAAAKFSGIPVATVSRRVAELEASLNVILLERSTRSLRLTEAGTILYDYISRGVEEMEAGLLALREQERDLRGRLRFSMPPAFEPMWVLLEKFQNLHKNIEVDLFVSERRLDFIEDGVDIALRVGNVASQTAVARSLISYRHRLVASPHFLEDISINSPQDILSVDCAAWSTRDKLIEWRLGEHSVLVHPFMQTNDYLHLRYLALQHHCHCLRNSPTIQRRMRNSSIADRDPCPYRIIEDIGGAFAFGAIGGGVWHFGKGAWNSPKGCFFLKFIFYLNLHLVTCQWWCRCESSSLIREHQNPLCGSILNYSL